MKKLLIATAALIAVSFVAADTAEAGHRHDRGLNVAFGGDNWQVSFGSPYRGSRGFYGPRPIYPQLGYGCRVPVYPRRPYLGRRPAVVVPHGNHWDVYPGGHFHGHH